MLPGEDEQTLVSHEYIWQLLRRHGRTPDDVEILRAVVYSHHVRFAALRNIGFPGRHARPTTARNERERLADEHDRALDRRSHHSSIDDVDGATELAEVQAAPVAELRAFFRRGTVVQSAEASDQHSSTLIRR